LRFFQGTFSVLTHTKLCVALDITSEAIIIHNGTLTLPASWVETEPSWIIQRKKSPLIFLNDDVLPANHTSQMYVALGFVTLTFLILIDFLDLWLP
jgi:hypothetical protein